jgi:hypothetical protein
MGVVVLVALDRSPLLALLVGAPGNVRPSPVRRRGLPALPAAHLLFEVGHQPTQEAVLFLEKSIRLEDQLVVLLVGAPLVGGKHDRPNLTALAHAIEGSASRISTLYAPKVGGQPAVKPPREGLPSSGKESLATTGSA